MRKGSHRLLGPHDLSPVCVCGVIGTLLPGGGGEVMLAFIDAAASLDDLSVPPKFGLHDLKAGRAGTWAMTVTRNWRLIFRVDEAGAMIDMDLEDYHGA